MIPESEIAFFELLLAAIPTRLRTRLSKLTPLGRAVVCERVNECMNEIPR